MPEWATENPSDYGGSFDATGAFHDADDDDPNKHHRHHHHQQHHHHQRLPPPIQEFNGNEQVSPHKLNSENERDEKEPIQGIVEEITHPVELPVMNEREIEKPVGEEVSFVVLKLVLLVFLFKLNFMM